MAIETIIVGGGQAGLAASYYLTQYGHPHVVLEQAARAGNAWRNERWDSFTWVIPNSVMRLPGLDNPSSDPDGYLPRDQIVRYFEDYVERFKLPVRFGVRVTAIEQAASGYCVVTGDETLEAANVVVATGGYFQIPKVPAFSRSLPGDIVQLHSGQYRNPQSLPPGAVLVVGSGQSGCQIAEDLYRSGRKVYLSVGGAGRAPRRYRGVDSFIWLKRIGFLDRTVDMLPSPEAKFVPAPQLTGAYGGHTINLHQFARDGVVLLGHIRDIQGGKIRLALDLKDSLAKADKIEADLIAAIDAYVERNGLNLPPERLPELRDGYETHDMPELDLSAAGIASVIWATGYSFDYSLVKLPIFDADGLPITKRGVVAEYPGMYFLGILWMDKFESGFLSVIWESASHIIKDIIGRSKA